MASDTRWVVLTGRAPVRKRVNPPIKDATWERHKDDITREYRDGGKKHMMKWMKDRFGFEARCV